jgi:hypothetical protein
MLIVVMAALAGMIVGAVALGPFVGLTKTDPRGPSIGAGLGGIAGLLVGAIWPITRKSKQD